MKQKPVIYYDDMIPPTYIRLVSERLNLDHIVHTEATEQPMRYSDIRRLAETGLFNITSTFRSTYLGNYRNTRDNQMLFIAAINSSYFRQLAQELILDPDYANAASIDVEAQRAAWVASGKAEAADWDDDKVKATPFKRTVYLAGNVKILGSMTDLIFPINLF